MKKFLSVVLAFAIIICAVPMGAFTFTASAATSGTTGDCTWSLDGTVLTISGNGAIAKYPVPDVPPWGTDITEIIIKNGVTHIGFGTFKNCNNLTSVSIPDNIISIGEYAFYNCVNLTDVQISDSVREIGFNAFLGTAYFNNESNWQGDVLYIGNHLITAKTTISGEYDIKKGTKTIAHNAFYNCKNLTKVNIPDSVVSINKNAFYYCSALAEINMGNGVEHIGYKAFIGCRNIIDITLPDSVTSIDGEAFCGCSNIIDITLPSGVVNIGENVFGYCEKLSNINVSSENNYYISVDGVLFDKLMTKLIQYPMGKTDSEYCIPDTVTVIASYAFFKCGNLQKITIPDSVVSIGARAFESTAHYNDDSNWQDGALYIDNHLIEFSSYRATSNDYVIKEGTKTIADEAFLAQSGINSVAIPDSVINIGYDAFVYCDLININVSEKNEYYLSLDGVLFNKSGTELIQYPTMKNQDLYVVPDGVETICDYAFFYCSNIVTVYLPETVASIGAYSFSCCSGLTSIFIPETVTEIGEKAFNSCDNLIICGCKFSYAESYAAENDVSFFIVFDSTNQGGNNVWESVSVDETGIYDVFVVMGTNIDSGSENATPAFAIYDKNGKDVYFNIKAGGYPLVKGEKYTIVAHNYILAYQFDPKGNTIFPDTVSGAWYNDAVAYSVGAGIITGYGGTNNFGTADNIQRQDFVVILARLAGVDLENYQSSRASFTDVPKGAYYEKAIMWAADSGITTGYADGSGKFGVGDNITREQLVTFLYRYAKYQNGGVAPEVSADAADKAAEYADFSAVTDYAKEAVIWALDNGIIKGQGGTHIAPAGNALRCEVAQIMYNIYLNDIF